MTAHNSASRLPPLVDRLSLALISSRLESRVTVRRCSTLVVYIHSRTEYPVLTVIGWQWKRVGSWVGFCPTAWMIVGVRKPEIMRSVGWRGGVEKARWRLALSCWRVRQRRPAFRNPLDLPPGSASCLDHGTARTCSPQCPEIRTMCEPALPSPSAERSWPIAHLGFCHHLGTANRGRR
jgi:hypothetical protein